MTSPSFKIRPCVESDAETLVNLVRELAVYEKLEAHARATPQSFLEHLFGPEKSAEAIVAEVGEEVIGFALFFKTFSTFRGQSGIYLDIMDRGEKSNYSTEGRYAGKSKIS